MGSGESKRWDVGRQRSISSARGEGIVTCAWRWWTPWTTTRSTGASSRCWDVVSCVWHSRARRRPVAQPGRPVARAHERAHEPEIACVARPLQPRPASSGPALPSSGRACPSRDRTRPTLHRRRIRMLPPRPARWGRGPRPTGRR